MIEYVMVMHDGGLATKFMSEDYCKDLMEQLAAAQSREVCTVAHDDCVLGVGEPNFCPYCEIERLINESEEMRKVRLMLYAERDYARQAARNADAKLAEAERDAALGRIAMRFVDRAGDVCDEDTARTICAEFYNAMANAVERQREARGLPAARLTDSADVVPCRTCGGSGAVDAPTSADDPSCPDCDGEGNAEHS